jgi:hypothetical protein
MVLFKTVAVVGQAETLNALTINGETVASIAMTASRFSSNTPPVIADCAAATGYADIKHHRALSHFGDQYSVASTGPADPALIGGPDHQHGFDYLFKESFR